MISRRSFLRHVGRLAAAGGAVIVAPARAIAQDRQVAIVIEALECAKTTEAGADEIYILSVGRYDGRDTKWVDRLPGDGIHWDMNDNPKLGWDRPSGDSHRVTNKQLVSVKLRPGQSVSLAFMIMEEDGGNSVTGQLAASAILVKIGNPYTVAAGGLLTALTKAGVFATDTDDYIGSFGAQVSNDGGVVSVKWRAIDRVYQVLPFKNGHEFDMNGDGSNYKCWVRWD
jgi:hypothetical protein